MRDSGLTIDFWRVENAIGTDFQGVIVHKNDVLVKYFQDTYPIIALKNAIAFVNCWSINGDVIQVNVTVS